MAQSNKKIILPGGAGLVGQNLIAKLKSRGYSNIIVLDKHLANLDKLRNIQKGIVAEAADLSTPGKWQQHFIDADIVIMLQAQIGGNDYRPFKDNNVTSTQLILDQVKLHHINRLIHISSSVVESAADDFYTETKKEQEKLVIDSGIACPILRPTLMFGWFDRKHLGWLSRFMKGAPIFPIPGNGRYMRQPLYAGDFCNIIIRCIENPDYNGIYNISGQEKFDYIEIIREIKRATHCSTPILKIPYWLFYTLLWTWGKFDRDPPFTIQQLSALTAHDEFEVIDWPRIFNIDQTLFKDAIEETFNHPQYSKIILEF